MRAARNTSTSDVRSGGIDSSSTDTGAHRLGQQAAPRAGDDAERDADNRRERSALSARMAVLAARSGIRSCTGRS